MNTKANCDPTIAVKKPAAPSVSRRDAVNLIVGAASGVSAQGLVGSSACAAASIAQSLPMRQQRNAFAK
jgi:hypothetical protein